jgi:hypothetical protein
MANNIDWEHLRLLMLLHLWRSRNEWQLFATLARELTSDPAAASSLAAIANYEPRIFRVHRDQRVKLTVEGLGLAESMAQPAPMQPAPSRRRSRRKLSASMPPNLIQLPFRFCTQTGVGAY